MDVFVQHMLQSQDSARELPNHQQELLSRAPYSAAGSVHWWLAAAEGDLSPPPLRLGRNF